MTFSVRRIRAAEWEQVRDLRLDAVRDPAASVAFLHTYDEESAHTDEFWQKRAAGAAEGTSVAQFVAEVEGSWIGTLSVLRWAAGTNDYHDLPVSTPTGGVVGVFVRQEHRGDGVIEALFEAAASWSESLGDAQLSLDVHTDNERAQRVYRRLGFVDTGRRFSAPIGVEIEMTRLVGGRVQS